MLNAQDFLLAFSATLICILLSSVDEVCSGVAETAKWSPLDSKIGHIVKYLYLASY